MDGFLLARLLGDFLFGFSTLFAIINPYGLAFVFLNETRGLTERDRATLGRRIAANAFVVLLVSLFAGASILGFFGISLPALRVGGGLVVAAAGWSMLNRAPDDGPTDSATATATDLQAARRMAFFPLTVPLTTGPGSIAAAIALAANRNDDLSGLLLSSLASLLVAAAISLTIFHAYRHAGTMARLFGTEGTRVVTRLSAFLLLCVGVQIIITGVTDVLRSLLVGETG